MSRLTEKQLLFLTVGITVLLAGGLGFLIWSDLKTIEEEETRISDLKTQIASAKKEIDLIPEREFRVIANREISDREVEFLPEEEEIENFWEVLERFAAEAGVRISEIAPSTGRSSGKRGQKTTIASVPQILSLRATVDELLRFINLVENYERIINVVEYGLSAGEVADEDGQIRHGVRLALTTFTYSRKIANTIVSIPKYDEKREHPEVKKWLSRIKIQEKETYTLSPSVGRRDPFISIRRPAVRDPEVSSPQNRTQQEAIIDNLSELVRSLSEGLDYEEELRKRGDLWRLRAQRKENKESFGQLVELIEQAEKDITIRDLVDRFQKDVVTPFDQIKQRMEALFEKDPPMPRAQVEEWLKRIQSLHDEREWTAVRKNVKDFEDQSRSGQHVADDAHELVAQISELGRSAKIIQAFEKRKVEISTCLYSDNGNSVAVINKKMFSEGDALDAEGTILVVEIGENYVIFETEGVEIKRHQK